MSSNMDTEPKTDVPERVINGQNPATSGNSLLGNRRENNVSVPYHKLGNIDLDQIIGRIAEGTYAADIAKELGCSKAALHYKLRQHPAYQEAKLIGVELRLDEGLIEMEAAGDDLNLVRAREARLRRLEWRAEREHPERWGQRTHVTHEDVTDLASKLRRARERTIGSGTTSSADPEQGTGSDT